MTRAKPSKPAKALKKAKKAVKGASSHGKASPERLQYAALPWRDLDGLEIMLVSSRETKRWISPKGWPMAGRSGSAAAAIEAIEEAGLLGVVSAEPIGSYPYAKRFSRSVESCRVEVYALRVVRQREFWPEKQERETRWFRAGEAMAAVSDPELADVIAGFIRSHRA